MDWLALLRSRFRNVRATSNGWACCCPIHKSGQEKQTSVSWLVYTGRLGDRVLVGECFACGSKTKELLGAVGLTFADILPPRPPRAALFLGGKRLGPTTTMARKVVETYDYCDEHGEILYQVVRYEPKDFRQRRPHNGDWIWELGQTRRVLYNLPELLQRPAESVLIVEGEKDANACMAVGLLATTNVGGAGKWQESYAQWLQDRSVAVIPDSDVAGIRHAYQVVGSLIDSGVKAVRLVHLPWAKDVAEFLADNNKQKLLQLVRNARAWT